MKAADLQAAIAVALDATDPYEAALSRDIERVLIQAGNEAARNFRKHATSLTASGEPKWGMPSQDEVLDTRKLAGKINHAVTPHRADALAAFAKHLPGCVPTPDAAAIRAATEERAASPQIVQARKTGLIADNVDRDHLRSLFTELDDLRAQSLTPGRQRKIMDEIRALTDLTPSAARKALDAEEGFLDVIAKPAPAVAAPAKADAESPHMEQLREAFANRSSYEGYRGQGLNEEERKVVLQKIIDTGTAFTEEVDARLGASGTWQAQLQPSNVAQRQATITNVLNEIRGVGRQNPFLYKQAAEYRRLVETIDEAAQVYPTSWLDALHALTEHQPLRVYRTQRGFYNEGLRTIALSGNGSRDMYSTAIHEIAHFIESAFPEIKQAEADFYARRTPGEELSQYAPGEYVRPDRFVDSYMGKDYDASQLNAPYALAKTSMPTAESQGFELLSMGMEELFSPLRWHRMWEDDPEMRDFILGLLVSF